MTEPVRFVLLPDRGILAVSGADRVEFLQGLVSNDVRKLAPGAPLYAALLTAQGKYLFDFLLIEAGDEIWIDAEAARLADLKRRLGLYRLRAKIALGERPEIGVAALLGTPAHAPAATIVPDPRLPELGSRAYLPRAEAARTLAGLGCVETEAGEYDRLRLSLGVPDGTRDLVLEKSILLESGFDELHGVDWTKGCYIGQELTARTKYRGLVKKRLIPVELDGVPPAPGTIVTSETGEAGEVRSGRDGIALALIRLDDLAANAALKAGETAIRPRKPSWARF